MQKISIVNGNNMRDITWLVDVSIIPKTVANVRQEIIIFINTKNGSFLSAYHLNEKLYASSFVSCNLGTMIES